MYVYMYVSLNHPPPPQTTGCGARGAPGARGLPGQVFGAVGGAAVAEGGLGGGERRGREDAGAKSNRKRVSILKLLGNEVFSRMLDYH